MYNIMMFCVWQKSKGQSIKNCLTEYDLLRKDIFSTSLRKLHELIFFLSASNCSYVDECNSLHAFITFTSQA